MRLVDSAASLGLRVKPDKCQISILNPRNRGVIQSLLKIEPLFKVIGIASLDLLGAPLLPPAVEPFLEKKLEDLSRLTEKLKLLDNHEAFFLLKNCFSMPKIMYLLRCAPCFMCPDTLERFDLMLRSSLQAVLNVTLDDRAWEVATLPVRLGGLGIRKASDLAVPTFLSSAFGSNAVAGTLLQESIVKKDYAFYAMAALEWKKSLDLDRESEGPVDKSIQELWDALVCKKKFDSLVDSGNSEEKAILLSTSADDASAWVHAAPISSLGLKLENSCFKIVCGLRIGAKICIPYKCICGSQVDSFGRHGLHCQKALGRFSRHSEGNMIIKRSLASIDIPSTLEPPGLSRSDGKRPDGLSHFTWKEGKYLVWDFTTSCTVAPSNLSTSVQGPGKTAEAREKSKCAKYAALGDSYHFVPISTETFGAMGPSTKRFIDELGKQLIEYSGERRAKFYLHQAIGCCIQKGNGSSILGSIPSGKKLEEIFNL